MGNQKINVGDIFLVPLLDGPWGVGLIGAVSGPSLVGFFFDCIYETQPKALVAEDVLGLDIILVAHFGYLGIRGLEWPVLGHLKDFQAYQWPALTFSMVDDPLKTAHIARYSDRLVEIGRWEPIPYESARRYPANGTYGHKILETELSRVVHNLPSPLPTHRDIRWRLVGNRYRSEFDSSD